jgi:hypothetical protein
MADACDASRPIRENPGAMLGLTLGGLAAEGRDKLTFITDPKLRSLGGWLEQLLAESTGKNGVGIIPVDGEDLTKAELYASDRVFAYIGLASERAEPPQLVELEAAGHPVIRIEVPDILHLGAEFFRWQFATAVAGSLLELNPFDQPDVEAAKNAARALMAAFEKTGALPAPAPLLVESDCTLFADDGDWTCEAQDAPAMVTAHLARLGPGDYFAVNAYLECSAEIDADLQALRLAVRDGRRVATALGYGPRFLHSTGQLHKGGPPSGVFLQVTAEPVEDLEVPGQRYSFGMLAGAQAQGDFEVLRERGRRALWIRLRDARTGVAQVRQWVERAVRA